MKKHIFYIILLLLLLFVITFKLFLGGVFVWGDYSYISTNSFQILLNQAFYTWNNVNFGTFTRGGFGNIPSILYTLIPYINSHFIFLLNYILPFFLITFSTYHVLGILFKNNKIAFLGSVFILINPVVIGDFLNGQTLLPYGTIIYATLFFIKIFYEKKYSTKNIFLFIVFIALTFFFLPPLLVPVSFFFFIFFIPTLFLIKQRELIALIKTIIIIGITLFLVSTPYIISGNSGNGAIASQSYINDYYHNYASTNIINTLRFAGNDGNAQQALGYNKTTFSNMSGYFFIVILLLSLIIIQKHKVKGLILFYGLSSILLFVILFLHVLATNNSFGTSFFELSWLTSTIRNPAKVYLIYFVFAIIILGYSNLILHSVFKKRYIYIWLIQLLCIITYGSSVFDGYYALSKNMNLSQGHVDPVIIKMVTDSDENNIKRAIIIPSNHQDELTYQNISTALSTLRLGGTYQSTEKFETLLNTAFNDEKLTLFVDLLNIAGVDGIYLKNNNTYNKDGHNNFGLFNVNIPYTHAKVFLKNALPDYIDESGYNLYLKKDNYKNIRAYSNMFLLKDNNYKSDIIFMDKVFYSNINFALEQKDIPGQKISQIFEDAISRDVKSGAVVDVENAGYKDILYHNANKRDLVIKTTDDKSEIVATKKERLIVNDEKLVDKDDTQVIFTLNDDYHNYYIKDGGTVIPFVNNARLNSEVPNEIYKTTVDNVVKNGNFNNSLWQDKVSDCNDYDERPVLSMKKVLGEGENNYVLQLETTKHIACTSQKNIPVQADKEYLVRFDYKPVNAKQAGFYLGFKNSSEGNYQSYSERLATPDYTRGEWQHYAKIIRIPQGTTDLSLYLYAYESDGEENNIVQYDNVSVQPVELVQTINPEEKKSFVKVDLPKANNGEYKFEYKDEQHNFANKIPNPSFENGLWAKRVGDCNHYDNNPVLGVEKIVKSKKFNVESDVQDKYALQFEATRHTACLSQKGIPVKGKTEYLFEFDYQGEKAKQAGYYIVFNDSNKTVINEKVPIAEKNWQTFHKRFTTPSDATSMTLYIYGYSKDEKTKVITRYDNFKLIELPNIANRYYLVSESPVGTTKPKETTFDLINPTKKLVHIKGATKPFYLTMSESYHDKWQAELNNGKVQGFFKSWVPFVKPDAISNDKHFKYMTFLNGWYVDPVELCESSKNNNLKTPQNSHSSNFDPLYTGGGQLKDGCTKNEDGSYDIEMVIEFTPQRYFYLGLLISGTTFISLIGYLIYDWYRRRRKTFF